MGRVSLVLPRVEGPFLPEESISGYRESLAASGHAVEVIVVLQPGARAPGESARGVDRWLNAPTPGLASAALAGLLAAEGDVCVVLDPTRGYSPTDLVRAIEPIALGDADLVTAARGSATTGGGVSLGPLRIRRGWAGGLARKILGSSDPLTGLVAIRPALVDEIAGTFLPVGSRFAIDLLMRTRGRKAEVSVDAPGDVDSAAFHVNDLRHFKRLADDRFGNASRLLQFCAVGASGMVIDLSSYALFQLVFSRTTLASGKAPLVGGSLDLAVSGALAIALALTWNFSLNRRLTFSYARHGSLVRQYLTYAMSNALGIALSFTLRLYLPARFAFFHDHKLAAAVVGIVTATGISFSLARWVVFAKHTAPGPGPSAGEVVSPPAGSLST